MSDEKACALTKTWSRLALLESRLAKMHARDNRKIKGDLEQAIEACTVLIVDDSATKIERHSDAVVINRGHLQKIIGACKEGVFVIDERGDIKETNAKMDKLLRQGENSILKTAQKLKYLIRTIKALPKYVDKNYPTFSVNSSLINVEIGSAPIHVQGVNIKDAAGAYRGQLYVFKDISERKKVEDEIKSVKATLRELLGKSEQEAIIEKLMEDFDERKVYLDNILESSADGIVTTDAFGFITRVNKAFAKLLGYSSRELEGKNWMEFSPFEEREFYTSCGDIISGTHYIEDSKQQMNDLLNKEECYFEGYCRRVDGLYVPVWCNLFWIHNKRGERTEGIIIARDLTERKRGERKLSKALEELKESKEYLENVIANSADAIFLTDANGVITNVNKAVEKFTGYSRNELIGKHLWTHFTEPQLTYQDEKFKKRGNFRNKLFAEGAVVGLEATWKSKSGEPIATEINCSLLKDDRDMVIGGVVCVRDIRERKRVQAMEIHNTFISNISHELRTPLTLSIGPLEGLLLGEGGSLDHPVREQIQLALSNNRQLLKMINQLLELARLESKSEVLAYCKKDINRFISTIADTFTFAAKKKNIRFYVKRGKGIPHAYIDPGKMEKVFFNIIGNAFKFTSPGGTIAIDIAGADEGTNGDWIKVSVTDSGIGIKPADLPHIFERFRQADSSSSMQHQGTGLGLSVAKEFMELQGGRIAVESEYGTGSTFSVYIPSGKEHIGELSEIKGDDAEMLLSQKEIEFSDLRYEDATPAEQVPSGERPLILFVDDNPDVRKYVSGILRTQYDVITAADGMEGLKKLQQHSPDLIIADVMMPRMDGYAFCKSIKSNPALQHIPIIFLTAKADVDFKIESLEEGADDYLVKPFNARELAVRVKCLLRIQELARENALKDKKVAELTEALGERYRYHELVGKSSPMQEMYRFLEKIKVTESPVLITGETGTGKELVAHAIQQNSRRKSRPFIILNCTAIHKNLMESELFGHVKGAFTGAVANKQGIFESADGGTLFLDEIGELSMETQVKLLRVLDEGTFRPVGSAREKKVDVRIITATNRDLKKMVDKGLFREDLYYRINVISIKVPPLRERTEDVPMLVEHFTTESGDDKHKGRKFSDKAITHLMKYSYPGNVRELKHIVESTLALCDSAIISSNELPPEVKGVGGRSLKHLRGDDQKTLGSAKKQAEKEAIMQALKQSKGNKFKAAKLLNISRTTLYAKIQAYRIKCSPSL
jgi:PAS domain S-box-containing protein